MVRRGPCCDFEVVDMVGMVVWRSCVHCGRIQQLSRRVILAHANLASHQYHVVGIGRDNDGVGQISDFRNWWAIFQFPARTSPVNDFVT